MNTIRKLNRCINEADELERSEPSDFNMKAYIKDMVDSLNSESEDGDWVEAEFNKRTGKYILSCINSDKGGIWFSSNNTKWYIKAFEQGAIESITGFPSLDIECPLDIMPPFDADDITLTNYYNLSHLANVWHPEYPEDAKLHLRGCRLNNLDFYYQLGFTPKLVIRECMFRNLSLHATSYNQLRPLDQYEY